MSFLFPSPKPPAAPAAPTPLPTRDDADVEAKRKELAAGLARKRRSGLATIKTQGLGLETSDPIIKRASLLGQSIGGEA